MKGFNELSIEKLAREIDSGSVDSREILRKCRDRHDLVEPRLNSLNRETFEQASHHIDNASADLELPYQGIPYVQKDNICTVGVATDCSSRILQGFVPPYGATADIRVQEAGFGLVGKSNMDEFGMGSSTEYSAWGPTHNPFDVTRVPGGSSGGSAASVAAGIASLAFGSDTGGSIRQPAAFCGNVGVRPTYGRVSRWGLISYASSLDQIGPISTTVRDNAIALQIIQGVDSYDSTLKTESSENYIETIEDGIEGLRLGVLDVSMADWVDDRVKKSFEANVEWFKGHAREVKEVSLRSFDQLLAAYYVLAPSEASSNLARYDGIRFGPSVDLSLSGKHADENTAGDLADLYTKNRSQGFGPEVVRRILMGTFALSWGYYKSYYLKAMAVRNRLKAEFESLWGEVDLVISPTTPTPPFKMGSATENPMDMYKADVLVLPQSMAGCPAISINGGWTDLDDDGVTKLIESGSHDIYGNPTERLPLGLQITAPRFGEALMYRAARTFEREHG